MPVTVDAVLEETAVVAVPVGEEQLQVTFAPNRYTPDFEEAIEKGAKGSRVLAQMLAGLVVEWDLIGRDGAPYPITEEALAKLGVRFLSRVIEAIVREVSPNSTTSSQD